MYFSDYSINFMLFGWREEGKFSRVYSQIAYIDITNTYLAPYNQKIMDGLMKFEEKYNEFTNGEIRYRAERSDAHLEEKDFDPYYFLKVKLWVKIIVTEIIIENLYAIIRERLRLEGGELDL